jgi:hypothetical protein
MHYPYQKEAGTAREVSKPEIISCSPLQNVVCLTTSTHSLSLSLSLFQNNKNKLKSIGKAKENKER